ncbi:hypothetical protein TNCV_4790011 [Trichonephila clavipes]|nr:hypothetical protein TNCV_4790011 [Trichonephila clavipes]
MEENRCRNYEKLIKSIPRPLKVVVDTKRYPTRALIYKCTYKPRNSTETFSSTKESLYTYILMSASEYVHDFLFNGDIHSRVLVQNKYFFSTIISSYIIFTKLLGPFLMKNQKPFQLNKIMIVYNFTLSTLNAYLAYHWGAHILRNSASPDWLNITVLNQWIGRKEPHPDEACIAWPPNSPDLTPWDFYLWGVHKGLCVCSSATS